MRFFVLLVVFWTIASFASAQEMVFFPASNGGNCGGCYWTSAEGEITQDTPDKFRQYLKNEKNPGRIILNSPGGNLFAGIELGRIIREFGMSTSIGATVSYDTKFEVVEGSCASACAFSFMGGVERQGIFRNRLGENGGSLGMHQFYNPSSESAPSASVQQTLGLILSFTLEMGIDPRVIAYSSLTLPKDMYWYSDDEMRFLGLDNGSDYFGAWAVEPYKKGMVLNAEYHFNVHDTKSVTVFCRRSTKMWHILISEKLDYQSLESEPMIETLRSALSKTNGMSFKVEGKEYTIGSKSIDFVNVDGNRYYLSLSLPIDLRSSPGMSFSFSPELSRMFGAVFFANGTIPDAGLLGLQSRNCI